MKPPVVEGNPWRPNFWWGMVGIIFAGQLGLIFWLGRVIPAQLRRAAPAQILGLAGHVRSPFLALTDPTLFARPHLRGFSGRAWMTPAPREFSPFSWSEPAHWLPLPPEDLNDPFQEFVATNSFAMPSTTSQTDPDLTLPRIPASEGFPKASSLVIAGDLARRTLLTPPELRSWPNSDLLTNSVVQILVDHEGHPVSANLLVKSGLADADKQALSLARGIRFKPEAQATSDSSLSGLIWGELIFAWHTVPLSTNSPAK